MYCALDCSPQRFNIFSKVFSKKRKQYGKICIILNVPLAKYKSDICAFEIGNQSPTTHNQIQMGLFTRARWTVRPILVSCLFEKTIYFSELPFCCCCSCVVVVEEAFIARLHEQTDISILRVIKYKGRQNEINKPLLCNMFLSADYQRQKLKMERLQNRVRKR